MHIRLFIYAKNIALKLNNICYINEFTHFHAVFSLHTDLIIAKWASVLKPTLYPNCRRRDVKACNKNKNAILKGKKQVVGERTKYIHTHPVWYYSSGINPYVFRNTPLCLVLWPHLTDVLCAASVYCQNTNLVVFHARDHVVFVKCYS